MGGASNKHLEYDGIVSMLLLLVVVVELAVWLLRFVGTGSAPTDCCCLVVELAEIVEKEDLCEDEDGSALLVVLRQVAVVSATEVLWQLLQSELLLL